MIRYKLTLAYAVKSHIQYI